MVVTVNSVDVITNTITQETYRSIYFYTMKRIQDVLKGREKAS